MLSQEELLAFAGTEPYYQNANADGGGGGGGGGCQVQLTAVTIRRIFDEYITYPPPHEMDYKMFLDLILALDNKTTAQSMAYFFRLLDIDRTGRIGPSNVNYFYSEVRAALKANGYDAPPPASVVIEVSDILSCNDIRGPCFADFVSSGQGHTVLSLLTDANEFWLYDNRESLMQSPTATQQS